MVELYTEYNQRPMYISEKYMDEEYFEGKKNLQLNWIFFKKIYLNLNNAFKLAI